MHKIVHADVFEALQLIEESPSLVYIDPPFGTGRDFIIDGIGYSDKWEDIDVYMAFMRKVIEGIHDVLDDNGSILLHCDYRASHRIAIALDEVFGTGDREKKHSAGFRNEFIWSYGLGGSSKRSYPKKHDSILWYTKSKDWYFDPPMIPGKAKVCPIKKQPDVLDYTMGNMNKERVGYPTQKPTKLLDMFVSAHTRPGELVADFFCGSGTTGVSAKRLGRMSWQSDANEDAVRIARKRLDKA